MALAYFITFSTYGTWLHGTSKGKGSVDREHNQYGMPFVEPDALREAQAHEQMKQPAYRMEADEREIVRDAIVKLCREKGWQLLALHVRSNHVHVVVAAERDPGRVMSDMKARASRALTRAGFDDAERKRWTRHGSTLHLFEEATVADKIDYTLNRQGTPMASHDGRNHEGEVRFEHGAMLVQHAITAPQSLIALPRIRFLLMRGRCWRPSKNTVRRKSSRTVQPTSEVR